MLAFVHRFGETGTLGQMDCFYSYWLTRRAEGFNEQELVGAARPRAGAGAGDQVGRSRSTSRARWAGSISGATPPSRCCAGESRAASPSGSMRCCGFPICAARPRSAKALRPTRSSRSSTIMRKPPSTPSMTPAATCSKLIGDGVLAMFTGEDMTLAKRAALRAEHRFRRNMIALNARRAAEGRPIDVGLCRPACRRGVLRQYRQRGPAGFHRGRTGGQRSQPHRLDVPLGRSRVPGSRKRFATASTRPDGSYLVSTGRFALRGIGRAQDLYHARSRDCARTRRWPKLRALSDGISA